VESKWLWPALQGAISRDIIISNLQPPPPTLPFFRREMKSYSLSKPSSFVDPEWIYWSTSDFAKIDPDSNQIAALFYLTRKKEVSLLFKPMPILNHEGKLIGILGNLLDKASTPVIAKIDADEVGSCFVIQNFNDIPDEFCPETPLIIDTVKDTAWESALNEIARCSLPSLVPIPFGIQIESCYYNEAFIDEMKKISPEHGFWAKIFTDIIEQTETNSNTVTIVQHLMTSKTTSTLCRDPCRSATKNFCNMTAASGPFIKFSLVGNK
jgi:hypothetical protein